MHRGTTVVHFELVILFLVSSQCRCYTNICITYILRHCSHLRFHFIIAAVRFVLFQRFTFLHFQMDKCYVYIHFLYITIPYLLPFQTFFCRFKHGLFKIKERTQYLSNNVIYFIFHWKDVLVILFLIFFCWTI